MSRKTILNLFLFFIVFALANFIYFDETQPTILDKISQLNIDTINTIKINHNAYETLIKKQDGHWKIKQPVEIFANEFRINSILKLINAPIHKQYDLDDINLESIGLLKPKTHISFNDKLISFGAINPATGLRYVQFNNKIYTLEDVYYPLLSSHFSTLVSFNLLPPKSKITKLILSNQTIHTDDQALWKSNIAMSPDNVAKAIDDWQTLQAFGVHEYIKRDDLGDVFIFTHNPSSPITYQITDIKPWLIIARPEIGLEYHLDIKAYKQLIAPQ